MNNIKMDRGYSRMKIKKCTFCQQLDSLKIECKTKKEDFLEEGKDKNVNGEKLKINRKVENLGVKN